MRRQVVRDEYFDNQPERKFVKDLMEYEIAKIKFSDAEDNEIAVKDVYIDGGVFADEKLLEVTQRNKFFVGDEIELLIPGEEFKTIKIEKMFNENMESIENCPHAMMKLYIPCEYECPMGTILRKAR